MRIIELSFQKNIRDLGGLVGFNGMKVKYNRLIRGGHLGKINEEDAEILKSLHITDVIDFRSKKQFEEQPDYRLEGVTYHNTPPLIEKIKKEDVQNADANLLWFVAQGDTGYTHMIKSYEEMIISDNGKKAYEGFFKIILEKENGVYYFHCSQGKDRAGVAAFLLEIALGVDIKVAKEDYLLTNKAMEVRVEYLLDNAKDKPFYDDAYKESMYNVFSAKLEYLDTAINAMIKESGSIMSYIEKVLEVDINKLRRLYLE